MDTATYEKGWALARPVMTRALEAVSAAISVHGLRLSVDGQAGDEEFSLTASITRDGCAIGYADFTLHDGEVHGEHGFSVSLKWEGPRGEIARRWAPFAYDDRCFVSDVGEILTRIEQQLDVQVVAEHIVEDLWNLEESQKS